MIKTIKMTFLLMLFFTLFACTKSVERPKNSISIALAEEPPNINSIKATDQVSFFILGHIQEGLLRIDAKGQLVPGVAERWDLSDSGVKFYLRKNAKWSDGKPVTAQDFVFSWRKIVEPQTASEYAFFIYPIKNAEEINKGKKPVTELGVKAIDDYTLEVSFEKPCGYFLSLTSFATYFPVREDFYNTVKEKYAADADKMLYNGPFKLTSWVHSSKLRLEKNENYWDKENIHLEMIDIPYITSDNNTRLTLFKTKKIDFVGLDSDTLKDAINNNYNIRKFSSGSVFYLEFNHRNDRVTRNKNLRKALQLVFDPKELVDKVIAVPGNLPGYSLFPSWLPGVKDSFQKEYPSTPWKVDVEQAKKLLEQAKKELKLSQLPDLVYLTGDSPTAMKQAEYLQNLFEKTLGLKLKIDKQTFKQRLAKMTSGEFDMVAAGWGPDYKDPMTFADLFASWNLNNRGRYNNPEYDKWIRIAQGTTDPKKRMDAMGKVQEIIDQDLPILTQYEAGEVYLVSDRLKGVVRNVVGADPYYVYTQVIEE